MFGGRQIEFDERLPHRIPLLLESLRTLAGFSEERWYRKRCRIVRRNVVDYVESLVAPGGPTGIHALAPCDWFSAPTNSHYPHEWSHALLEFREYVLFDTLARQLVCLTFAFD